MEVEADGNTATWSTEWVPNGDTYSWSLPDPVDLYSSTQPGLLLATIGGLSISLETDPFVALGFNVTAGAAPANFTISSAVVPVAPPINNGLAFATAGITLTESSPYDGASLTGLFPGSKTYEAQYNGASSVFADLVPSLSVPPLGLTGTATEKYPLGVGTRTVIPGLVTDMQSQFKFTLSALDQASGTSIFDIIVPEPSSIGLAMFGLVGALWHVARRRRK